MNWFRIKGHAIDVEELFLSSRSIIRFRSV